MAKVIRDQVGGDKVARDKIAVTGDGSQVIIGAQPPRPIPFQLPRRAVHFQGRERELTTLLEHLRPGAVVTLCGPVGVGKTALAAEALARLPKDRFPDGVITHTFYRQPEAALALEHITRSYGLKPRPTPADAARMALVGKRALLVLEETEEADDLGAILACAGGCGVLITSQSRGDAPDPARRFDVGPLEKAWAVALLRAWGGTQADDEAAVHTICRLVGGLPLAIRLAGAYLAHTDEEAADYLAWLKTTPLAALDFGQKQHQSAPVLMERSLERVSERARAALGLVGLMGFAPFGREAIAAGLEVEEGEAGRVLGELVDYGLLTRQDGRYAVTHALIHTHARQRLSPREEAREHLAVHYLSLAQGTDDHAVLNTERPHLLAVLSDAHRRRSWELTLGLAMALDGWLDLQGHWTDRVAVLWQALDAAHRLDNWRNVGICLGRLGDACTALGQVEQAIQCYQKALEITRGIGDQQMEGTVLGGLGNAYADLMQVEQAIEYYQQALAISREIGDQRGERACLDNLGLAYRKLGQVKQAIEYYTQALQIAREIGDRWNEMTRLGTLVNAHYSLGQMEEAIEYCTQALQIARKIGNRRGEGIWLSGLGLAYAALGQLEKAIEYYTRALEIAREIGDLQNEGTWLGHLGRVYRALSDTTHARQYLSQALAIFEEIKSPDAEQIRRWLAELD